MQKWEYRLVHFESDADAQWVVKALEDGRLMFGRGPYVHFAEYLNQLGEAGWEMTGVGENGFRVNLFFKRCLNDEQHKPRRPLSVPKNAAKQVKPVHKADVHGLSQ